MYKETDLISTVREFATGILQNNLSENCLYHNYDHTKSVVGAFIELGVASGLTDSEMEVGVVAAWCHDLGFSEAPNNHEEESTRIAAKFLKSQGCKEVFIQHVNDTILATRMPQSPTTLLQKVMCDADLHHLGSVDYLEVGENLRQENIRRFGIEIPQSEWNRNSYFFFNDHEFFTDAARNRFGEQKKLNTESLRHGIKEFKAADKKVKKLEEQLSKASKKLVLKPDRGIETMFRTTSRNHLELSSIADNKANIMISVNTLLITILVTAAFQRVEEYPNLAIPIGALILVSLATIVISILATRPNISKGTFTKDDIEKKRTNLLFFGNFHGMSLDDYEWGVREMMKDAEYLYGTLTKDIYYLGKVLGKKYRLLRLAYNTFMIGFVVCILLFLLTMLVFPDDMFYRV